MAERRIFPDDFLDKFLCGDALEILKEIPDESVDIAITSPPYNLRNSTRNSKSGGGGKWTAEILIKGYANYDDNRPHDEYVKWQREIITEIMRILKPEGALFYNHKWRIQDRLLQDRHDIVQGFPVRQIIIWQKAGGVNFTPYYFLPTYEVIYMITKPKFKLVPKANAIGDVWRVTQERKNRHPAPFPVALIDKIINSTHGQIIIDPFMGSGTTALAAKKAGRNFIGIDLSQEYCDMAKERLRGFEQTGIDPFQLEKRKRRVKSSK
jgi:modification methylase